MSASEARRTLWRGSDSVGEISACEQAQDATLPRGRGKARQAKPTGQRQAQAQFPDLSCAIPGLLDPGSGRGSERSGEKSRNRAIGALGGVAISALLAGSLMSTPALAGKDGVVFDGAATNNAVASGFDSFAISSSNGGAATASGFESTASGAGPAIGDGGVAIGALSTASGVGGIAIGASSSASGAVGARVGLTYAW